jgi:hypothetical protein
MIVGSRASEPSSFRLTRTLTAAGSVIADGGIGGLPAAKELIAQRAHQRVTTTGAQGSREGG